MKFNLQTLVDIAHTAGLKDKSSAALVASMATVESAGDPHALGDRVHGVPTSFGLLQVHEPDFAAIAVATRGVMAAPFVTDYGRSVAEIALAAKIFEGAATQATRAAKTLRDRGFQVGPVDVLLLVDAAWQGPGIETWAERTSTGQVDEIREGTSPGRTQKVREHLASLGFRQESQPGSAGWILPVMGVGAAGAILWAAFETWG